MIDSAAMSRGSKLIAVSEEARDGVAPSDAHDSEAAQAVLEEEPTYQDDADPEWDDEPHTAKANRGWIATALAILLIAGWTGFFGWVHYREMLAGASPLQWSEWVVAWAVPVLLVMAAWMLVLRNSTREARRFGDTAALLSTESARLEERLTVVNRELSLAREFLAAESRELDTLGRVAGAKLSEHANHLQSLVHQQWRASRCDCNRQLDRIGEYEQAARRSAGYCEFCARRIEPDRKRWPNCSWAIGRYGAWF